MVKEITSLAEFEREISGPGLVVVDFFTTWCGPCKQIAPFIEGLQAKYPDVKFIKVDIEKNEDIAAPRRISSIPTFHFFVGGNLKHEMKGANPSSLESKVVELRVDVNPFAGKGFKLSDSAGSTMSAREARLKAFQKDEPKGSSSSDAPQKSEKASVELDEDEALAKALELSIAEAAVASKAEAHPTSAKSAEVDKTQEELEYAAAEAEQDEIDRKGGDEWGEEMVPVPVDESLLQQLLEMGFTDVRGRKSIVHGKNLEGALAWLSEHQDDPDIDQPYMVRKADATPKVSLTEEEKAQRVIAIRERVKQRRVEREKLEKAEELRREKERRERGQKIDETVEERQRLQRKREAEKLKREKAEAEKERLRLRAEIQRDKEARRANKGVLPSVLGVDGYNPSIIQYDQPPPAAAPNASATSAAPQATAPAAPPSASVPLPTTTTAPPVVKVAKKQATAQPASSAIDTSPAEKIDTAISTIMRYRTGGDGGEALKLLTTFVKNVCNNPAETKYRSINPESGAFKSKLSSLVGPAVILKALGFEKSEEDGKLKAEGSIDLSLFQSTLRKLEEAELRYRQMNP